MNKEITESGLVFVFSDISDAVKFDDTAFYRNEFNALPEGKGVDIIADSQDFIQLIEVKNCTGHETENVWRTSINNSKLNSAPHDLDVENRDSLDIEVAKKIASTLTCIYGAWSKNAVSPKANELEFIWKGLSATKLVSHKKRIVVILYLEGNFGTKTRSKRMIMKSIQDSIKTKLKWLNCSIHVVDKDTYSDRYFYVK